LEGCRLAAENAERLAEDSRVLGRNNRVQSAYAVSLDAWEELGKAVLLFRYFKQKEDISLEDWRQILRDHKHKRVAWVHSMDLLYGETPSKPVLQLKDALERAINEEDWGKWFDLEREIGVYVDWLDLKEHWRSPCQIDKALFHAVPFDSEYWTVAAIFQCKHFREIIEGERREMAAKMAISQ